MKYAVAFSLMFIGFTQQTMTFPADTQSPTQGAVISTQNTGA